MKLKVTEWIRTGEIHPLKWWDSASKIKESFVGSSKEIQKLINFGYPYLVLDFVEFYFETDDFKRLDEILIKNISVQKGIETEFLDPDWLTEGLTLEMVQNKLTELKIKWKTERGPHFNTPNIRTSKGVLLAFDPNRDNDLDAELVKIYLKKY